MSLTSLNTVYLFNEINRFFPMNGKVTVNATLVLTDTSHTRSLVVKRDIQKKLIEVIQVGGFTLTYKVCPRGNGLVDKAVDNKNL